MNDKEFIDQFLNQLFELMGDAQDQRRHQFKEKLPEDLEEQIVQLENDIQNFISINEQIFSDSGFPESKIQDALKDPVKHVNPESQKVLEKAKKLKGEVEHALRSVTASVEVIKRRESMEGKGDQASLNVARMKKFKRVGGKKGWKPI